jgi:hypothetical protein
MKNLQKIICNMNTIHSGQILSSITQYNPSKWINIYGSLPHLQKNNYDCSNIHEDHKFKVDFNIFYGGLTNIQELKNCDMLIKPFSGNLIYHTFSDDVLLNTSQVSEQLSNIILKEYDNESYCFENNDYFPVYALTIFEKSQLELYDK